MSGTGVCRKWSMKEAKTFPKDCPLKPAYDIDKVIEQLENLQKKNMEKEENCDKNGFGDGEQIYEDGRTQGMYEAYSKALEIVKEVQAASANRR